MLPGFWPGASARCEAAADRAIGHGTWWTRRNASDDGRIGLEARQFRGSREACRSSFAGRSA
jgi:hypothetical protein